MTSVLFSSSYAILNKLKSSLTLIGLLYFLFTASGSNAQPGSLVDSLLLGANQALSKKRLTTPEHDNAYDRFQSVLLMDPDNSQARAGLQAILISYAQYIRDDLRQSRLSSARKHLSRMTDYYPDNPLVDDLQKEFHQAQASYRKSRVKETAITRVEEQDFREISISAQLLRTKSPELIGQLGDIARELKRSDESILIYARSDADGRWIYKQLRRAVKGYRVRGDIRIGKPKLRILPPID